MIINTNKKQISEAILCSIGLMVFSFFIQYPFPVHCISFAALIVPSYIFGKNIKSLSDLRKITGEPTSVKSLIIYSQTGLMLGILLAMLYRWYLGMSLLPSSFHYFVFIAACIGSFEEIIFRGFIQEYAKSVNPSFSILFSTVSHTGYKCLLFLTPLASSGIDVANLAFWTFLFGIVFGTMRHFSRSIFPSLIAHSVFDILVYAEYIKAPWWVW